MSFKVVHELIENPGRFAVANFSGKAAAIFLYLSQGFWAFQHDPGKLK
jgi:hypothetical protein